MHGGKGKKQQHNAAEPTEMIMERADTSEPLDSGVKLLEFDYRVC